MTPNAILVAAARAARAAGAILADQCRPPTANAFAGFTPALPYARGPAIAALRNALSAARPDVPFVDDPAIELPADGEAWVIDPLDGVDQYLRGLPYWCVSVTLVRNRSPVIAVLHSPVRRETYTAGSGLGAWRDGRGVQPAHTADLALAVLAMSAPARVAEQPDAALRAGLSLAAVLPVAGAVRNLGATSWQIAEVAAGRLDGFWEYGSDTISLLGAFLIAREAGAVVTDTRGRGWTTASPGFLAAGPALHCQLLRLLATVE